MTTSSTVHVIDDDEAVRTSLVFALGVAGFAVEGYKDAADFLGRLQSERGVLICDFRMPGMNGIELTRRLHTSGSLLRIVVMTGHSDRALQDEAMLAGAEVVLEKPTAFPTLLEEISRLTADGP